MGVLARDDDRPRRTRRLAAVLAIVPLALACGTQPADGMPAGDRGTGTGRTASPSRSPHNASATPTLPPGPTLPSASSGPAPFMTGGVQTPPEFDRARGWRVKPAWFPKSGGEYPVDVVSVPGQDLVAYVDKPSTTSQAYVLVARDASTGDVRWKSAPWTPAAPPPDHADDSEGVPEVQTAVVDGVPRVVASLYGRAGGHDVMDIATYPATARGTGVRPEHTGRIVLPDGVGLNGIGDGTDAMITGWEHFDDATHRVVNGEATFDLRTGAIRSYPDLRSLDPTCNELCSIVAVVDGRRLMQFGDGSFGIVGGWRSSDVAPRAAKPGDGYVLGLSGHRLIANWTKRGTDDAAVWSVHDVTTGALQASVICDDYEPDLGSQAMVFSADPGRQYVVSGAKLIDIDHRSAVCTPGPSARFPFVGLEGVGVPTGIGLGAANGKLSSYGNAIDPSEEYGSVTIGVTWSPGARPIVRTYADNVAVPFLQVGRAGLFKTVVGGTQLGFEVHPRRISGPIKTR